jgi:hypothetical protein
MKLNMKNLKIFVPALLLLLIATTGCSDKSVKIYTANVPVYADAATWRATSFALGTPTPLTNPGKIYLYNDLLIVNERMKGVHIYDNSNPSAPQNLGFLAVLANVDIAVRNNIMYLDSYSDLLAFDISDPRQPHYLNRLPDVFSFDNYLDIPGLNSNLPVTNVDPSLGIVTGWKQEKTTEDIYGYYGRGGVLEDFANTTSGGVVGLANFPGVGQGGSTARFTIQDHHLYTLEDRELGVFDIAEGMIHVSDIGLTRTSETLFPQNGYLYIGTTTGLSIYSLSNPSNPTFVSDFAHVRSCDPVVVQGDKAFVTLSSGTNCGGSVNSLFVIDLSNIATPTLLYEYPLTNPKGLGVDGNTLFLCDGADGLKIFDKTDLSQINNHQISHFGGIVAADVIPYNQVLILTSEAGIFQYSYADLNNIVELSRIAVAQ